MKTCKPNDAFGRPLHRLEIARKVFDHIELKRCHFDSIIDVGGAQGAWLHAARERFKATRIRCYDHPDMRTRELLIDSENYTFCDLEQREKQFNQADLAICVECLEHLSPDAAERVFELLCSSASALLFSAALPRQDGVGHINGRWSAHWRRRLLDNGFVEMTDFKRKILFDSSIPYYLRQNLSLYIKKDEGIKCIQLARPNDDLLFVPLDFEIVHHQILKKPYRLRELFKMLWLSIKRKLIGS
ncbi:MAG: class I SAM-dependent methyltransferase [Opitutales bacterium]|nr:class I SAM-dependent methyltransferase [Opitutales bacterium]